MFTVLGSLSALAALAARFVISEGEASDDPRTHEVILGGLALTSSVCWLLSLRERGYWWGKVPAGIGMLVLAFDSLCSVYPSLDYERGQDPVGFRYNPETRASGVEPPAGLR